MREKLRGGVARACAKTMVTAEQIDDLVDAVENELASHGKREIPATMLGELALARLRSLDQVAYVRFASVYRQFRSVGDFVAELDTFQDAAAILSNEKPEKKRTAAVAGTPPLTD